MFRSLSDIASHFFGSIYPYPRQMYFMGSSRFDGLIGESLSTPYRRSRSPKSTLPVLTFLRSGSSARECVRWDHKNRRPCRRSRNSTARCQDSTGHRRTRPDERQSAYSLPAVGRFDRYFGRLAFVRQEKHQKLGRLGRTCVFRHDMRFLGRLIPALACCIGGGLLSL